MELHRRRGAPDGNKNRLKHGRYTAATRAQRKRVRVAICSAQKVLLWTKLEFARGSQPDVDSST